MKKTFLFGMFAGVIGVCANAYADGYVETETTNTYEKITVDTVKYIDGNYIAPATVRVAKPTPCRAASSLDVAKTCRKHCGCAKSAHLQPVRVKTYSEIIDHYQVYQPVVTYKPAGTYSTRRYIQAPNPHCGTCAR